MSPLIISSILIGADTLVGEMVKSRIPHMRGRGVGTVHRAHLHGADIGFERGTYL